MARFEFASNREVKITVAGQTYELKPGRYLGTNDPCEFINLYEAWKKEFEKLGVSTGTKEITPGIYDEALYECTKTLFEEIIDTPLPASLPNGPEPDPSEKDGEKLEEVESADSLGAPNPTILGIISTDNRIDNIAVKTPGERLYDPIHPKTLGEIVNEEIENGKSPEEVRADIDRARQNSSFPGERHPQHSKDRQSGLAATIDPVEIFSGQFALDLIDVEIASPGLPLQLHRIYRSGAVWFGPWGFQWDHNYNLFIRPLMNGDVAVWTGQIHEEIYKPNDNNNFDPPLGVFRNLEYFPATARMNERWIITEREGIQLIFERPQAWPDQSRIPLAIIKDRNGNQQDLTYDGTNLYQVSDKYGRYIRFDYNDQGLVELVADHTGRTWRYYYNSEIEHLIRVVGPDVNKDKEGQTINYEYDERKPHPALQHNLIAIIDNIGQTLVFNTYCDDPASDNFGRIICQEYADEISIFSAERLQRVPRLPDAINVPCIRVTVDDPGTIYINTFNYRGDLLDKRYRLVKDNSFRLLPEIFRYDNQGNLIEHYLADGRGMKYQYDEKNSDPCARGTLLSALQCASPLKPSPSIEVFHCKYEPKYWQPKELYDAAGQKTIYIYDYELSPDKSGTGNLIELHRPSTIQPDGLVVDCKETFHYTAEGQLSRHEENGIVHEFEYSKSERSEGYLVKRKTTKGNQTYQEQYKRDAIGNITAKIDGIGNTTEYKYDAANHIREVIKADGTFWKFQYDYSGRLVHVYEPRGDYDDSILVGRPIRHDFFYSPAGYLIKEVYASNTILPRTISYKRNTTGNIVEVNDPTGYRATYKYDERGLTLEEKIFDGKKVIQIRKFTYTRTGELSRLEVSGSVVVQFEYDGFGRLYKFTNASGSQFLYTRDSRGLVTQTDIFGRLGGSGTPDGLLARQRQEYNEMGNLRLRIDELFCDPEGPFTDITTSIWRDPGQLITKKRDPRGFEEFYTYNGTGKISSYTDSLGNSISSSFDAAGRVTGIETNESFMRNTSHKFQSITYDSSGRVLCETDAMGNCVCYIYDDSGQLKKAINSIGKEINFRYNAHHEIIEQSLENWSILFLRDNGGRITEIEDPSRTKTTYQYDILSRLIKVIRQDQNSQTFTYNDDGTLNQFINFDGTCIEYRNSKSGFPSTISARPGQNVSPTVPIMYEYDGLNRIVRSMHDGYVVTRRYDSLNRLLEEKSNESVKYFYDSCGLERRIEYPDGRQDLYNYDILGRLTEISNVSLGNLPLPQHGLQPGTIIGQFDWAGKNQLVAMKTVGQLSANYTYDNASRLVEKKWIHNNQDLFKQTLFRNKIGLILAECKYDGSFTEQVYDIDDLTRLKKIKFGIPVGTLPQTVFGKSQNEINSIIELALSQSAMHNVDLSFTMGDALSSRTDTDVNSSIISKHEYFTNTLNQYTSIDGITMKYDLRGNVVTNGEKNYKFDAFGRLVEVSIQGDSAVKIHYDAHGRTRELDCLGDKTIFTYIGDDLIQTKKNGIIDKQFVIGPFPDQPILVSGNDGSHLLIYDNAGSLVSISDLTGFVIEKYQYDVFGKPKILQPDGITELPQSTIGLHPYFHGNPWIAEAGLYDFHSRHYDPQIIGFLQPDPIAYEGSWNPYAFVRYNPYNYTDSRGTVIWGLIVAGAIIGAAISGFATWMSGGEPSDIVVASGAGCIGGALTSAGHPIEGAAIAGGIMGAWSGGNIGYQLGDAKGAIIGVLSGGAVGASIGALTGSIGKWTGNVATPIYGAAFNAAKNMGWRGASQVMTARLSGMIAGGYAGGLISGIVGNTASVAIIDIATDNEITMDQMDDAILHGVLIDGPLGAVGASAERFALVKMIPRYSNVQWRPNTPLFGRNLGFEGEILSGRSIRVNPANTSETILIPGTSRTRKPDFPTDITFRRYGAIYESKNVSQLSQRDVFQIRDFARYAGNLNGSLRLYHRPGMDITPIGGIINIETSSIPQQPFLLVFPKLLSSGETHSLNDGK